MSDLFAVPHEEHGVHYGEVAPEGLLLILRRILSSAVVVQDKANAAHSAEAGCFPVGPGVVAELLGAAGVSARPAAERLHGSAAGVGIHERFGPGGVVEQVDADVFALLARRHSVAVGEGCAGFLYVEEHE